jgi:predicted proteasome-type protease
MYQAANAFADEVRKVRSEDAQWLISSNLSFDLHCIIGGQLEQDDEPHMFLVYPEGNWVEVRTGTPYVIIGDTRYGKPIRLPGGRRALPPRLVRDQRGPLLSRGPGPDGPQMGRGD